jgi:hypothetical protein
LLHVQLLKGGKSVANPETKIDRKAGHLIRTATQSGIELRTSYKPEDIKHLVYEKDLGNLGE